MKREIKFRAWTAKNREMAYEGWNGDIFYSKREIFAQGEDAEIMQFTGLLDKNGKEIYEGDVCTLFTDRPTEILFKNGGFGYRDSTQESFISFASNYHFEFDSTGKSSHIEIIGNIYENPELTTP